MDYIKEIERIQREQERAIRASQLKSEQLVREAMARADHAATPPVAAEPAKPARRTRPTARPPAASGPDAVARAVSSAPPGALAFAARVVRAVLLVPILAALSFVVGGAMETWDGYYLHPGELVSVIVPLLVIVGLLKLRRRLADPQSWVREAAQPGAKQAVQGSIGRWVVVVVMLVIATVFLEDFFPRGLPVGEWLGWPQPVSSPGA